ncbi:alanine--tRNA ligase [Longibaculum muris]|uniref:alanine--tRNA ligase n=1 Tax=Longibaculum muris TaxID=1796628 RepID=UPI003AB84B6A
MKQLTGNQVRQMFLDYFQSKGHMIEPGASLIPQNDPTLLWINAGVAALKKYFDGSETPACNRIANAQKSIRTNDIENVGKTARHHTFFEMLGNFSIGDYFKAEAIPFAWEFLTSEEWIGFDKDKLYVTVYTDDDEAYRIWTEVCHVDESHILKTDGNFWEIGEGPGGPDSEIFYDRGEKYDPEGLGEKLFFEELENDRYIEVWNVVFSQYDCNPAIDRKDYKELPQKNIDTGMGLERLVSIIQGGETNFDTDFFLPIIHATEAMTNVKYEDNKMAYRVIADHIRTVTFALSDGALFDNAGRGYVLRRILRRAVRYGKKIGIDHSFMYELVYVVADIMKDFYDYLPAKADYVSGLVKKEEEAFHKTLSNGEKLLTQMLSKAQDHQLNGKDAFKLYDTYGFPLELTVEIAEESGFTVDEEGFKAEMKAQQERARNARGDVESMSSQKPDLMAFDTPSVFTYDPTPITAKVIATFIDGVKCDEITDKGEIILDQTTFYAEMGGQCADSGTMSFKTTKVQVNHVTKAPHQQHLHMIVVESGSVKVGDELTLYVDTQKRALIQNNHTATHLLQKALKNVLGDHVSQAGSYVDEERLRFDFTHPQKMSDEEIRKVEDEVNAQIFKGIAVDIKLMSKEEAMQSGAMALFNEKYGDEVRVVSVGDYSKELCGGCHVSNSSQIGLFKIMSEESVGSGVRRIEAVTSFSAYLALKKNEETLQTIGDLLKLKNRNEIVEKVTHYIDEANAVKKERDQYLDKLNSLEAKEKSKNIEEINGVQFLYITENKDAQTAKAMTFELRDQLQNGLVLMVSEYEGKVSYFVGLTASMVQNGFKAGNFVKMINEVTGGRGGGKPDFAQGGCASIEGIEQAIAQIKAQF